MRGLVLVMMALEYVRLFLCSPDAHGPGVFFTHWVTLAWAPGFIFLFGMAAYLKLKEGMSRKSLSLFLLGRGLFLMALEILVVGFLWDFTPNIFPLYLQIIWVLGFSMIALAALLWLPVPAIFGISLAVIAGHNLFDQASLGEGYGANIAWGLIHGPTAVCKEICKDPAQEPVYAFMEFPLVPWFAVMALGFASAKLLFLDQARRTRLLGLVGLAAIAAFTALRYFNLYGDPTPWAPSSDPMWQIASFLKPNKYPPSLQFVLMTLGLLALLWAALEKVKPALTGFLGVFGKASLFFYVLALLAAHTLALIFGVAQGHEVAGFVRGFWNFPKGFGIALVWVYASWLAVIAFLYPLSDWYGSLRERSKALLLAWF